MERLRYSDRKRLAEQGNLGDLSHDSVTEALATAVRSLIETGARYVGDHMRRNLENALIQHFGEANQWFTFFNSGPLVDDFLDAVEIFSEQATTNIYYSSRNYIPIPDVDARLTQLFQRHRFGYRISDGQIERIGSPSLSESVVGPALLAVHRPGWEEVERSYREAVLHQRGGETDDAITSANAAVESALKAIGLSGQTLGALAKSFRSSGLVPGYLIGVPESLEDLLNRLNAARSTDGDAHGKAPGAAAVPQALADLAVHWAGAFLVYLAATVP